MGHGLGTCCKAERPQGKGCSFQEGKGILEKNFGTTVGPRISELPADEGAPADVQGLCWLLGNLHNNCLKRRFCRSLGLVGSTRGPVNAGEGAVAHCVPARAWLVAPSPSGAAGLQHQRGLGATAATGTLPPRAPSKQ